MSTAEFPALLSSHTMEAKAITVCELLQSLPCKMTPKSFLLHFLQSDNLDLAYRPRYWAESAVDSTLVLVKATTEAEIIWSPPPQHLQIIKMGPNVAAKAFDTADVYQDQEHIPYF
ncbi:hypothetical protein PGT21_019111 [Puccinia graminis f. sp. tritici]|uniref:Uncharacterized protein n=1 Tax=Puccinia graminis f. sp. tritici TaxID=56615 RepID=A0A5B0Q682_PUCGR|nr:hypothetical protein PGT21_019111 [Puccinia graminis f. sp. tritici]